jgi:hypothetical protein
MQAIKKLASILEEMAPQKAPPPRVEATEQRTNIPPRVESPPTQKVSKGAKEDGTAPQGNQRGPV